MTVRALLDLPVARRRRLAAALRSGALGAPFAPAALRSMVGVRDDTEAAGVASALREWDALGVSGRAAAVWLASLEEAEGRRTGSDFVWSGPGVPGLHARRTGDVFGQLLASAERSVWLSTFAWYDGPRAFEPLAERMAATPDLRVTLLLNIERKRGDTTAAEELVRRFADRFWGHDWRWERRPDVFYDPRSLAPGGAEGVLHAKALVVDERQVLLTSANLTEAALERNIEMGVLLRDPAFAKTVVAHFETLIATGSLVRLPAT